MALLLTIKIFEMQNPDLLLIFPKHFIALLIIDKFYEIVSISGFNVICACILYFVCRVFLTLWFFYPN